MQVNEFKPLDTFIMNEYPLTCPYCGSRCEELASFHHTNTKHSIQKCLDNECGFLCYEEEDAYFLKL